MLTIFLSALAVLGLFTLFWCLFGLFLVPVGTLETVQIRILAQGDAGSLEHILSGLCWLRQTGLLEGHIHVVDAGLTREGRERAALLVHTHPGIDLTNSSE